MSAIREAAEALFNKAYPDDARAWEELPKATQELYESWVRAAFEAIDPQAMAKGLYDMYAFRHKITRPWSEVHYGPREIWTNNAMDALVYLNGGCDG